VLLRYAKQYEIEIDPRVYSSERGHGRVISELKRFFEDIAHDVSDLPDLLVVAIDCNCHTYSSRRDEITKIVGDYSTFLITALPDPHIERWSLLDSSAFKNVFGMGCDAPDKKCEKNRYKNILRSEIQKTGSITLLGGKEYFIDIVENMDFNRMEKIGESLSDFLRDLRFMFEKWSR